jgi:pimeloyl-ACP methyl ester carboxylesterase
MAGNIARPARRECVICLHCSGAGASEWSRLTEALGDNYDVLAPEHYGCESRGHWPGEHVFTLADEAAKAIEIVDAAAEEKVHLVGHSYGGGVALHIALARPSRVRSMALYEPSAFHLLPQLGEAGIKAHHEIAGVAGRIGRGIVTGDYRGGLAAFVDYWSEPGSWDALRPSVQNALIRWAPKGPLDFQALMEEPTSISTYRILPFPVLLLRGERAPSPTRIITECLQELLPVSRTRVIDNAGHMGPLTHAPEVARLIAQHIVEATSKRVAVPTRATGPAQRHASAGEIGSGNC